TPYQLRRALVGGAALTTLTVLAAFAFYLVQRHNCGRFACLFFGRSFSINEFPTHGLHTHKVVYFAGVYVFAVPVFFVFGGVRLCTALPVTVVMHAIPAKTRSGGILGPIGCFGKFSFLDSCGACSLWGQGRSWKALPRRRCVLDFTSSFAATALFIFIGGWPDHRLAPRHASSQKTPRRRGQLPAVCPRHSPMGGREEGTRRNWWAVPWSEDVPLRWAHTAHLSLRVSVSLLGGSLCSVHREMEWLRQLCRKTVR
ncbi:uncharacterized protein Tco025E_10013, partial [Trypanosoma conorhini]